MPSNGVTDLVPALAVPVLTAALGGLGLMIKDARRKKDYEHRAKTRLEMATLEVQFVANWLQVRRTLGDSSAAVQQAERWLDRCYRSAEEAGRDTAVSPPFSRLRRLLLLQPLTRDSAQVARLGYWGAFAMFNLLMIVVLQKIIQWLAAGQAYAHGGDIFALVITLAAVALFAASLRKGALAMNKESRDPHVTPPPRSRSSWPPGPHGRSPERRWTLVLVVILLVVALSAALGYWLTTLDQGAPG
ncbi:hypothetical protein [Streptomyces sp. NPDC096033]|uniref:hypothetical protein n=1 Tax=Streptomyces sp. NPDC096033 TaxID=3366071 RepID=UPI0037FBBA8C